MTDSTWLLEDGTPAEADRRDWWRRLPSPALAERNVSDPAGYDPAPGLLDALNAALILGQPLLLTGEPGCGKTEAANYLAWRLGLDRGASDPSGDAALRFDIKSTTNAKDLFYSFDLVGRFSAAQLQEDTDPLRFLSLNALGRAIFEASTDRPEKLRARLIPGAGADPQRSVVLIDEIDKAPRDVPNDLLVEFEKLRFYVTEIDHSFVASPRYRPILILTSNRERDLPDAFLRRCVVFTVPFPNKDRLRKIVSARIQNVDDGVVEQAMGLTLNLREAGLRRRPGTAELISFVAALKGVGASAATGIAGVANWQQLARTTLLKNSHDHDIVSDAAMTQMLTA